MQEDRGGRGKVSIGRAVHDQWEEGNGQGDSIMRRAAGLPVCAVDKRFSPTLWLVCIGVQHDQNNQYAGARRGAYLAPTAPLRASRVSPPSIQQQQGVPAGAAFAVFWLSSGLQPEPAREGADLPNLLLPQQLAPTSEPATSNHTDTDSNASSNEDSISLSAS